MIDRLAIDQMGIDDFVDIAFIEVAIPNAFGVEHHDGPFFAAVEAARLVDPHLARTRQAQLFHTLLGVGLHLFGTASRAARAFSAFGTLVEAEENVTLVIIHTAPKVKPKP